MEETNRILVADDEENIRFVLRECLEREGHEVVEAVDGQAAVEAVQRESFALAILDVRMPRLDGIQALEAIRRIDPMLQVVMVTAHGGRRIALDAIRLGAYDYFDKPFEMAELRIVVKRALERRALVRQINALEDQLRTEHAFRNIVGESPAMKRVLDLVSRVMVTDATVLITGESGTGKELIADALHYNGPRARQPFLKVNCAAIPETLLESELFGHEKGAFTGAIRLKPGKFEMADKGTIFLDEIGDMPFALQSKILRVLQEKEVERVGGQRVIPVDVRLIAATNKDLIQETRAGRFREDLFFRLNVVPVPLPPLRERREDIALLIEHFTKRYNAEHSKAIDGFTREAMTALKAYAWPGNIRQLENVIQRAAILSSGRILGVEALPPEVIAGHSDLTPIAGVPVSITSAIDLKDFSEPMTAKIERLASSVEAQLIRAGLEKTGGRRQETADLLGISRKSLHNKMLKHGLFGEEETDKIV